MKQLSIYILLIISLLLSANVSAQSNKPTQTIRGVIIDNASGSPLPYVSVGLLDLPGIGTTTDDEGKFAINNVPVGRHDLQATFIGYILPKHYLCSHPSNIYACRCKTAKVTHG